MPPPVSRLGAASCAALVAMSAVAFAGSVDETALREYVRQQRPDRVELETRRLERLNPDWKPPADLWTARPSGPDESPLWELFERNDLDGLRKAIAQRRLDEPGWQPSGDLTDKMKTRELRAVLFARAAAGQWAEVAKLADENGVSGGTTDIELLWIVAEGLARTERSGEAATLYRFVLTTRTVAAERTAAVQKALATLPMAEAEKLIAMGKIGPDGRSEFDAIRLDITRARISAILRNDPGNPVQPADVAALEDAARLSSASGDARLLAWYDYRAGRFDAALEWFKTSLDREGDAMTAHGLALTMLKLGMRRDAEEVAYTWREHLSNNMILFIDILETDLTKEVPPYIEPARLARYAEVATKTQSGEGAQGLAWYAYNSCQFETAHEWFARAVAWFPKEATLYGYGLTLVRLKKRHELVELVNRYDGLFPRVVGLMFRDDYIHPPTPCEVKAHPQLASNAAPAPYWQPSKIKIAPGDPYAGRRVVRADFPVQVSMDNPLRYALRGVAPLDGTSQSGQPYRVDGPFKPPLTARRVPGAEAMPYERFGVALLPAYNGGPTVSFHAGAYRSAANGTIWSEENPGRDAPQASTPPRASTAPQASLASQPVPPRRPAP